jgi:hypothetical protein
LTNGNSYSIEVRAENVLGPSPWSPLSASVVPAGKPAAPGQPTVTPVPNDPTGKKVAVQWPAVTGANANGDPVSTYSIAVSQGTAQVGASVTLTPTSATQNPITYLATGLTNALAYTFTVTSTNKAGTSAPSAASAPFTVFGAPGAISDLKASNYDNGQTTLTFSQPAFNGSAVLGYQVSVGGGGFTPLATNGIVNGLSNGKSYSFTVEGCNVYCSSTPSNPATAIPDAPPTLIGVSMSAGGATGNTFTLIWPAPVASGPACAFSQAGAQEGFGTSSVGPWTYSTPGTSGTYSFNGPYNVTQTLYVLAKDGCGLPSVVSANAIANHTAYTFNTIGQPVARELQFCRGNPNYHNGNTDMPGGTFAQSMTVPAGVGTIHAVSARIDIGVFPNPYLNLSLSVNGSVRANGTLTGTNNVTTWSFGDIAVSAGDSVSLNGSMADPAGAWNEQIDGIFQVGISPGSFSWSNSCVQSNDSGSGGALEAQISGWGA